MEMKWIILNKTCEEKCFALGQNVFPFLPLYPLHHCLNGGYHGDTVGPFLIGCQDEVRVTRKVETRRCWG